MENCPVCHYSAQVNTWDSGGRFNVDCPRCGDFCITKIAKDKLQTPEAEQNDWRWRLSYWIRKGQKDGKRFEIDRNFLIKVIEDIELPRPSEQANNLVRWLAQNLRHPEDSKTIDPSRISSIVGCKDGSGVHYIASHLKDQEYFTYEYQTQMGTSGPTSVTLGLTFKGWHKIEELKRSGDAGYIVFMAMQYQDQEHTKIYKNRFKKAVSETGFELRRLDETLKAGLIDNQLRIQIRNARLVLADLTNDNNGAYWEAGYAEGLGIPVIYLCERSHFDKFKTHFDTNHRTTIIWDKNNLEQALENLKATIRATFPADAKMTDD